MTEAKVIAINISPSMRKPMETLLNAPLSKDTGIKGDRYANGSGAFSKSKRENVPPELVGNTGGRAVVRDVSLISIEDINQANADFGTNFTFPDTRRNILVEGIPDLKKLIGVVFTLGSVALLGIEACDPCDRPSKLSGKDGFKEAFENRGGLRAQVLEDGEISVGDTLVAAIR